MRRRERVRVINDNYRGKVGVVEFVDYWKTCQDKDNVMYLINFEDGHKSRWINKSNVKILSKERKLKKIQKITIFWSKEDNTYITLISNLPSFSAFGDTPQESLKEALIGYSQIDEAYEKEEIQ